jgi:hypothetical protein
MLVFCVLSHNTCKIAKIGKGFVNSFQINYKVKHILGEHSMHGRYILGKQYK